MTEVFVVAPADITSGGPELCHQLVDTLNKDRPGCASIIYHPFDRRHLVPARYRHYDVRAAAVEDITPGAIVVLPETYGQLVADFPDCRVYYWWMSVNNFYRQAVNRPQLAEIRQHTVLHLFQSEYARRFLVSARLGPVARLSDRLSSTYLDAVACPPDVQRNDVVAINPVKGASRTALVLRALAKGLREPPRVVALKDLSADQIRWVLSSAKVYIDFGEHPGKDRLPREAAALGACVLTNRRGSAGNQIDVPIPDEFKIDDRRAKFEYRAVAQIHRLLDDFENQAPRFDGYRRVIAAEGRMFVDDVRAAFRDVMACKVATL